MSNSITHTMYDIQTIACLGDSITAGFTDEDGLGWVARLGQLLAKDMPLKYGIQSCGISGDTIYDAWHNLRSQVSHINPDILIIHIGVNDTCIREGIAPESFQIAKADRMDYWIRILDYVVKNYPRTLVISPLPIEDDIIRYKAWDDAAGGQTAFRYEQQAIVEYNNDLSILCRNHNVSYFDLFEKMKNFPDYKSLFADGLHPNAKGHQYVAESIFEHFKTIKL